MTISSPRNPQIIDLMKARGWEHQDRCDAPKHQEITFRSQRPTLLFNGGEERQPITFRYDRDLYFRKSGAGLFISPAMGKVAYYQGWPTPDSSTAGLTSDGAAQPLQDAVVHSLNEFWTRLEEMAGEMKTIGMPARSPPDAERIWQAVRATCAAQGPT